jgi:hypothetical protein
MKMQRLFYGLSILLALGLVFSACSREDDPTPEEFREISFDGDVVLDKVPDGLKNSTDTYAQMCYGYIQSAVDMSSFIETMEVPDDARKSNAKSSGDTWSWSFSDGARSWTFYWTYEESGGKRYWSMDVQFDGGATYDYIDAWESMDGTEGEVVYNFMWAYVYTGEEYSEEDFQYWRYAWELANDGTYTLTYIIDSDDPEYDVLYNYVVTVNDDGSGEVALYFYDELWYLMTWAVDGSGTWAWYLEDGSEFSGAWPAA